MPKHITVRSLPSSIGCAGYAKWKFATWQTRLISVLFLAFIAAGAARAASDLHGDTTQGNLDRCLANPEKASTGGQTECETIAEHEYDGRMNEAYAKLLKLLPASAGESLRQSQRAWIVFRDTETRARDALYATRQGTMYVPMETDDRTNVTRDRALQLEKYQQMMAIEE
ncbi:lysozyme inhibitor LprI family protein [Phyllobacterium myrsinacearum]|uniref:Uncharacterized protein YecT (DUF1311 family) n=1 Tax=Phyllobacterium myrsinacearum TaxID=28101 RepID=A0A839EL86_9HYPH|nr:lysozyme inhibitor LprI family protein [Phyllobacterium myrsinacearum]MBA8879048.1 uncharacterized protein YecT (DUF1311 family) [Phyllobacterium myrsinacearum]